MLGAFAAPDEGLVVVAPEPLTVFDREGSALFRLCLGEIRSLDGALKEYCADAIRKVAESDLQRIISENQNAISELSNRTEALKLSHQIFNDALSGQFHRADTIFYISMVILSVGFLTSMVQFYFSAKSEKGVSFSVGEGGLSINNLWIGVAILILTIIFAISYMYFAFSIDIFSMESQLIMGSE